MGIPVQQAAAIQDKCVQNQTVTRRKKRLEKFGGAFSFYRSIDHDVEVNV
jgi:hypothetical protein